MENEGLENVQFSHEELVNLTREAIYKIIESDPLFRGLPSDATVEEIKAQTAVAQGQAITVYLTRGKLPKLAIVIPPHNTTVLDLKKAIECQTNLSLKREKVYKKISWKHVWKKYHIHFDEIPLSNDEENIKTYGVSNRVELHYRKRYREKNKIRHGVKN
ncbi:U11/U12 small nuclear ribonucleoprotein 25 kDa protein isoform X2 [Diachasma alloeum]|uniref:U11/U12 small nuclear ribonucleoprotein 25 kDa protein isoform X2 n=1 Tax=Diachasma alloeum TaxID=454923 RepID=UPI0007381366|nr:U11/U12 small nuclear ribonucleoprotein 25 kDa protein isoform X2 [Diachasma alloeum]